MKEQPNNEPTCLSKRTHTAEPSPQREMDVTKNVLMCQIALFLFVGEEGIFSSRPAYGSDVGQMAWLSDEAILGWAESWCRQEFAKTSFSARQLKRVAITKETTGHVAEVETPPPTKTRTDKK